MPTHQGLAPVAAIWSDSAISSSQVVGTVQPFFLKVVGEYQTRSLKPSAFGTPK